MPNMGAANTLGESPDGAFVRLDGVDSISNTTAQAYGFTDTWSIGIWWRLGATPGAAGTLFETKPSGTNNSRITIDQTVTGAGELRVQIWDNTTAQFKDLAYDAFPETYEGWTFLVVTYDGSVGGDPVVVYRNGEAVAATTTTLNGTGAMNNVATRHLAFGAGIAGGTPLQVDLQSAVIWTAALTAAAVRELWTAGVKDFDPKANGGNYASSGSVVHWWRFGRPLGSVGAGSTYVTDEVSTAPRDLPNGGAAATDLRIGGVLVGARANAPTGVSIDLDGTSEYLATAAPVVLNALGKRFLDGVALGGDRWTISCWVRSTDIAATRTILDISPTSGNLNRIQLRQVTSPNGSLQLRIWDHLGNAATDLKWNSVLVANEWRFLAISRRESMPLTILSVGRAAAIGDGYAASVAISTTTTNLVTFARDQGRRVFLGASRDAADFWQGQLGHVAIWSTDLPGFPDLAEIYARRFGANLRLAASGSSLRHWWRLGTRAANLDGPDLLSYRADVGAGAVGVTYQADVVGIAP